MKRKSNLNNFIFLVGIIILLLVILAIGTILLNTPQNKSQTSLSPTPSPARNVQSNRPPVQYNEDAQQQLVDKINHKPTLEFSDQKAKQILLASLNNQSGIAYQSPQITIGYLKTGDFFQVEILTTNIQTAKDEANVWFRAQGLSQKGICNLPVQFFLNWNIANQLRNQNIIFNPLPQGC